MMIDELLGNHDFSLIPPAFQSIYDEFNNSFVVKAQNVADYLYQGTEKEIWDMEQDFPNVAPPFPDMWFEWRLPKVSNSEGKLQTMDMGGLPFGVYLNSRDISRDPPITIPGKIFPITKQFKWFCSAYLFSKIDHTTPKPLSLMNWVVDDAGKLTFPKGKPVSLVVRRFVSEADPRLEEKLRVPFFVPLMTLSFMHCKNVSVEKSEPWPVNLQRSREKNGKRPLVRWHTVVIDPLKQTTTTSSQGNGKSLPKSLHICRGHFKHFVDKGLFGKYHGTYWWPMHTRGSAENGVVNKDYAVKAGVLSEVANGVG